MAEPVRSVSRLMASLGLLGLGWACSPEAPPPTDEARLDRLEEMVADVESRFPDVVQVSVDEVRRLLAKDSVLLVDVRSDEERAVSMLPGAISAEEYEASPERYAGVAVVAYCTVGARSSRFAAAMGERGFDVRNLSGSILAWTHAGGELDHEGEPTTDVHVYGESWDLAPTKYHAIW